MWILSRTGFFSAVADREPGVIRVRARVRADLDRLRAECPALGPTIATENNDYAYRARVPVAEFAQWVSSEAARIDYTNFKNMVFSIFGAAREHIYHAVWAELLALRNLNPVGRASGDTSKGKRSRKGLGAGLF